MSSHTPDTGSAAPRTFNVLLAVVLALSAVGFAVGIRQVNIPAPAPAAVSPQGRARPSLPYRALRRRTLGPSSVVSSPLSALRAGIPAVGDPLTRTEQQRQQALTARASRRAHAGAPPTVPHPIDERTSDSCLACHEHGVRLEGRTAPVVSHPAYASCTQCHVPALEGGPPAALTVANSFAGRAEAGRGARASKIAPPVVPHITWMRQRCQSCHGVTGRPGLRTTHPERNSCIQCHAPTLGVTPWRQGI